MSKPQRDRSPVDLVRKIWSTLTGRAEAAVFITGTVTAALQTVVIREVFAVMSGNELVIGLLLAMWLAATAAGSICGRRFPVRNRSVIFAALPVFFVIGLVAIRAIRLLLPPGEALSPQMLFPLLVVGEAPGAFCGGYLFGWLAGKNRNDPIYRWEQIGSLTGFIALSILLLLRVPNWTVALLVLPSVLPLIRGSVLRGVAVLACAVLFISDAYTTAWKYPLTVERLDYTPEAEVASANVGDGELVFVNGELYLTGFTVPAMEQSVHTPMGMHRGARRILLINSTGQRREAVKYSGVSVECIRTDHLIRDTCCPYTPLASLSGRRFDVVIMGCAMPENGAASRFFTRSFFREIHALVGDRGVFSFTLPFQTDFTDEREEELRSILLSTLGSVFTHVRIFPGVGFTFVASDTDYPFADRCTVPTDYYESTVLVSLTEKRMTFANRPPSEHHMHTAAHPRLLMVALERYLSMFPRSRLMITVILLLLLVASIPVVRVSRDGASVGSTGMCVSIYSMALLLLFQSYYGTVYMQVSVLLLSLAAGFAGGSFLRRFPFSDIVTGAAMGGTLLLLALPDKPPGIFFYFCNGLAGFLAAAQFVTRTFTRIEFLYAADCAGGIFGAALSATVLIPLAGIRLVAVGIFSIKLLMEIYMRVFPGWRNPG